MAQEVRLVKVFPYSNYAVVEWRRNGDFQYVACWSPWIVDDNETPTERRPEAKDNNTEVSMYWGQGHYFEKLETAMCYAIDEEREAFDSHIRWLEDNL